MPTPYTSAVSGGRYNASDVNTWGQGIGVFPNTANDVVTVAAGHTVHVDGVYTHQLGAMTVNGTLNYLNDRNTALLLGHANLTMSSTGKVSIGTASSPIPAAYTAKLQWNPTSDNAIGLVKQTTGIFEAYGDSEVYGSEPVTYLYANWTTGQTFQVEGNFSAKWKAGQELYVHKNTTYSSYLTDVALVTISGTPTWDGVKTTVTIVEAFPTGTFFAGGIVLNATRNITIGKLNPVKTIGTVNTNRPRILSETGSSDITGNKFIAKDVCFEGVGNMQLISKEKLENFIVRNGGNTANVSTGVRRFHLKKGALITFGVSYAAQPTLEEVYMFGTSFPMVNCQSAVFKKCYFYSNLPGYSHQSNGNWDKDCYIFGNEYGLFLCHGIFRGTIGVSPKGQNSANGFDGYLSQYWSGVGTGLILKNVKLRANTFSINRNNLSHSAGKYYSEHHYQVKDAHWAFDMLGDIIKNTSVKRTNGSASSIEIIPLSNCGASSDYPLVAVDKWTEHNVPASQQTRLIYILGEGWTVFPTDAQLYLSAEYLDHATNMTTVIALSALSADTSTWTGSGSAQKYKATVTFTPQQVGTVTYNIVLLKYEASSKVFVENALYRDGMPRLDAVWNTGESWIDSDYRGKYSIFGGNIIRRKS